MKVTITPKNQRAKNRCNEHGFIMMLKDMKLDGTFLVESLDDTWNGEKWLGWFTKDEASCEEAGK